MLLWLIDYSSINIIIFGYSGLVETVPETTNELERILKEDIFASFRRKSSHKDRAIDLIQRYNNPETPLKDLVDTKEHNYKSLLQWASIRGWSDVCELLIRDHQCDPFYEDENDWTVLHNVCCKGHFDLVRYYVSKPFLMDPLKKNKQGTTPLDYSIHHGLTDISDYLKSIIGKFNHINDQFFRSILINIIVSACIVISYWHQLFIMYT